MTQDGAGKLGEEALDEVEPGAVLGRERKLSHRLREQSRANDSRSSVSPISSGALKPATDLWNDQMC